MHNLLADLSIFRIKTFDMAHISCQMNGVKYFLMNNKITMQTIDNRLYLKYFFSYH